MYYKLNNDEFEIIKKVEKITLSDYEQIDNFIPVESMMCAIENLLSELDEKEKEFDDFKQNVEDNYRLIPVSEQVGISDRDFI